MTPPRKRVGDPYEVGYRKPPKHTQFSPGRSGNPKGRPKGAKSCKADLLEELGERIPVREGNRWRRLTKQRVFLKALMTRALNGDTKYASLLISIMERLGRFDSRADRDDPANDEDTAAIMAALDELERDDPGDE